MDFALILAQTSKVTAPLTHEQIDYGARYVLQVLDQVWQQATALSWLQAVVAISFGVIPLMYGWRIYKTLTVIGFALLGLHLGMWVGGGFDNVLLGAIVGAVLLAVVAVPLMRWAVCVLGAVAGGVLAAGAWYAFNLPQQYVWAGALVGVVAGAMLSFVVFKVAVMLFTSFGGASLIIVGVFSLIYRYETFVCDPPTTNLNHFYYNNHWFFPLILAGCTLVGIIIQFRFVRGSKDWSI